MKAEIVRVPLTQEQFAVIDKGDEALVLKHKWHATYNLATKSYYATTRIQHAPGNREVLRMHQLIMNSPRGSTVDHINHDTLDNTRANLRIATHAENSRNRRYLQATNKSGYVGVSWHNRDQRWLARIAVHGRMIHIGSFRQAVNAAMARDEYIRKNFSTEFFVFNFPQDGETGIEKR